MVATLVAIIILGVAAAAFLSQASPSPSTSAGTSGTPGATTTAPSSVGGGADIAAQSACLVDFRSITSALSDYRTLNGVLPDPGIAWATSTEHGGPFITTWPAQPRYFTLTWNGTVLSVHPARGVASHGTAGSSSPPTGCYSA